MEKDKTEQTKINEIKYSWHIPYEVVLGEVYEKFLNGLKEKKILGNVCPKCKGLHVPAKQFCEQCFEANTDWVETDGIATLITFSICYMPFPTIPFDPPSITGILKVGDSITNFLHHISNVPFESQADLESKLKIGMKFKPVWKEERIGDMFDIAYFEPA